MAPSVETHADAGALHRAAAAHIAGAAAEAVRARGRFLLALSGGETPRGLYRLLAGDASGALPWTETELFFGDERCVPPHDPASSFRLAQESLLAGPFAPRRVYRIEGERGAREAAEQYDTALRHALGEPGKGAAWYSFDVTLLGVGADGHVASLFPRGPAVDERGGFAIAVEAPEGTAVRERVSVTMPVLDASRLVLLLVTGESKQDVVRRALAGDETLPAARLRAERVVWLLDRAASPAR